MATPPKDRNQIAASIVAQTTGQPTPSSKNPFAVALGKLGASKGGKARAASLTKKERSKIAKNAAKARWAEEKK